MFDYKYVAIDNRKRKVRGIIRAASEEDALRKLTHARMEILKIRQKLNLRGTIRETWRNLIERIGEYSVILFTKELSIMLKVGIPIDQAFETLATHQDNEKMRKVITHVRQDLRSGFTVSNALNKHPRIFPPLFKALVEVGEATGQLAEILGELSLYLEKEFDTRRRIYSALSYPIFVMVFTIIILTVLMAYYIPSFVNFLEGMQVELPATTKVLMYLVHLFQNPLSLVLIMITIVILYYLYYNYSRTLIGRFNIDKVRINIPVFGQIIIMTNMARFARTCALMYKCGIGMGKIMEASTQVVDVAPLQAIFEECKDEIFAGMTFAQSIGGKEYVSPLMRSFLTLADETGDVVLSMEKIAEIYDGIVSFRIETLINLLEPLFMGVVAFVVGFISLSLFLPIYSVISSMGT